MDWQHGTLGLAAFLAGFVDAISGGGGLLQLPALLLSYPSAPLAVLFGTNKLASIWGTATAAYRYANRVHFRYLLLLPALLAALLGGWGGARTVAHLPVAVMRPIALVLLVLVGIYTALSPHLGLRHSPRLRPRAEIGVGCGIALGIGFYDGVFGPGTGTFLIFLWVRFLGFDFLHASAYAKCLNVATNFAALAYFLPHGSVFWGVAGIMAVCNILGALCGTHLALRHGSHFVRRAFLGVVAVLVVKLASDMLR